MKHWLLGPFKWPNGAAWMLTDGMTRSSRARRFRLFMTSAAPRASSTVLDVGVSNNRGRSTNFLESLYPWPEAIVAVAHGEEADFDDFRRAFPKTKLVFADGRDLPFADRAFDIVFTNAVVEHAGTREEQRRFVSECLRVGDVLFLSTPNASFPVDAHTLLPFVHWLPWRVRYAIYRRLGLDYWADVNHLNLLNRAALLALFPSDCTVRLREDRVMGMTMTFAVMASAGRCS
jgi:hypothetical protein